MVVCWLDSEEIVVFQGRSWSREGGGGGGERREGAEEAEENGVQGF